MLSISGMSSSLALSLIDKTETKLLQSIEDTPGQAKAIASFRANVGAITTADQFVNNYPTYNLVMKAFGLGDQMFGKAMIKQILQSDRTDSSSLVNKLTDPRFTQLYTTLGFTAAGTANANTSSTDWQDAMVKRYVNQQFIDQETAQNATVGTVLKFRDAAPSVKTWYDILKDKDMGQFMRTALGLPDNEVSLPLDRQVADFTAKFDITKLQDPAEAAKLVRKYVAVSDAKSVQANISSNPIVQMMQSAISGPSDIGQFVPITLDIPAVAVSGLRFTASSR